MSRIGIVGLGNMGRAIAERLVAEGEALSVWNRTAGKADGLSVGDAVRFLGVETVYAPSLEGSGQEAREVEQVVNIPAFLVLGMILPHALPGRGLGDNGGRSDEIGLHSFDVVIGR